MPSFITSAIVPAARNHRHQQCQHRSHSGGCVHPRYTVVDEPRKGLVVARETGRRVSTGDVLVYVDADCRAPREWLAARRAGIRRPESARSGHRSLSVLRLGHRRARARAHVRLQPRAATHVLAQYVFGLGAVLYGGNFAVRRDALEAIGGFDTSIEFHGEDTNLARRISKVGRVRLRQRARCSPPRAATRPWGAEKSSASTSGTSAPKSSSIGRPTPPTKTFAPEYMPGYEPFLLCDFHVHTTWSDGRLTLREVVDLYGQTEKFDVLAITDHILARRICSAESAGWRRSAGGGFRSRRTPSTTTWPTSRRKARAPSGSTACS